MSISPMSQHQLHSTITNPLVKHLHNHQHQHHLEVQTERADEEHNDHDHKQIKSAPHIANTLHHLPLAAYNPWHQNKLQRAHLLQREDDHAERHSIDQEDKPNTDEHDEKTNDYKSNHPTKIERNTVKNNRVLQIIATDHLNDEQLTHKRIDNHANTKQQREQEDVPHLNHTNDVKQPQHNTHHNHRYLNQHQHLTLEEAINHNPHERREQQHRQELQTNHDTERDTTVPKQLQHEPILNHPLHPGSNVRNEPTNDIKPIVTYVQ